MIKFDVSEIKALVPLLIRAVEVFGLSFVVAATFVVFFMRFVGV